MEEKKKYRYTKQLINMALRDGWTQKQIADTCRTQQSVVSAWKNGSAQARESQLQKLLELYGPKLRRRAFKIYHDFGVDDTGENCIRMIKVEGEVILSFPYRNQEFCAKCHALIANGRCSSACDAKTRKFLPTRRLVVHAMGKGEFLLISQRRLIKDEHLMKFLEINIFSSRVMDRYSAQDLLGCIDGIQQKIEDASEINGAENTILRILIRKALLEYGCPIDGLEVHHAAC